MSDERDFGDRELERILYFEAYVVIDAGDCPEVQERQVLSEDEFRDLQDRFPADFQAGMGAEAIKELLARIDVETLARDARAQAGRGSRQVLEERVAPDSTLRKLHTHLARPSSGETPP